MSADNPKHKDIPAAAKKSETQKSFLAFLRSIQFRRQAAPKAEPNGGAHFARLESRLGRPRRSYGEERHLIRSAN